MNLTMKARQIERGTIPKVLKQLRDLETRAPVAHELNGRSNRGASDARMAPQFESN